MAYRFPWDRDDVSYIQGYFDPAWIATVLANNTATVLWYDLIADQTGWQEFATKLEARAFAEDKVATLALCEVAVLQWLDSYALRTKPSE